MGRYRQNHPNVWLIPIALSVGTFIATLIIFIVFKVTQGEVEEVTSAATRLKNEWTAGVCSIKKYSTEQIKLTGSTPTSYDKGSTCHISKQTTLPGTQVIVTSHEEASVYSEPEDKVEPMRRRRRRTRRTKRRRSSSGKTTQSKPSYDYFTRSYAVVDVMQSDATTVVASDRHIYATFDTRHCGYIETNSSDFVINNSKLQELAQNPQECYYNDSSIHDPQESTGNDVDVFLSASAEGTISYFSSTETGLFVAFVVLLIIDFVLLLTSFILYKVYHPKEKPSSSNSFAPREDYSATADLGNIDSLFPGHNRGFSGMNNTSFNTSDNLPGMAQPVTAPTMMMAQPPSMIGQQPGLFQPQPPQDNLATPNPPPGNWEAQMNGMFA